MHTHDVPFAHLGGKAAWPLSSVAGAASSTCAMVRCPLPHARQHPPVPYLVRVLPQVVQLVHGTYGRLLRNRVAQHGVPGDGCRGCRTRGREWGRRRTGCKVPVHGPHSRDASGPCSAAVRWRVCLHAPRPSHPSPHPRRHEAPGAPLQGVNVLRFRGRHVCVSSFWPEDTRGAVANLLHPFHFPCPASRRHLKPPHALVAGLDARRAPQALVRRAHAQGAVVLVLEDAVKPRLDQLAVGTVPRDGGYRMQPMGTPCLVVYAKEHEAWGHGPMPEAGASLATLKPANTLAPR